MLLDTHVLVWILLERDLEHDLVELGFYILPATGAIMQAAGCLDWSHLDPFDRVIVATAAHHNFQVISRDKTLNTCPEPAIRRIW